MSKLSLNALNKSAVSLAQVELCWTHGTMLSRIVVYRTQWQYWSSEAQFDALIACASQARIQFGIDAFCDPVCAKANPDHKARSKRTNVVAVNIAFTCKRMDAKMRKPLWNQMAYRLNIYVAFGQWLRIRRAADVSPCSLLFFCPYPCSIFCDTTCQTGERHYPSGSSHHSRL